MHYRRCTISSVIVHDSTMYALALVLSVLALATSTPVLEYPGHFKNLPPGSFVMPDVPMLDGRIVGGQQVSIQDYPWQLSLQVGTSHICGGSIISSTWTVTAAHCVSGQSAANLRYRAGSSARASGGTLHQVAGGAVHGSYSSSTLDNDIAVLRVSTAFSLGSASVRSVALLAANGNPATGATAWVSGWGVTSSGSNTLPAQLRAVDVPIVSLASCRSSYGTSAVTARMLCAGWTNGGRDACQGDSGGPLVVGSTLVGIVSWGRGCAQAGFPGVYAHVGALRTWIQNQSGV